MENNERDHKFKVSDEVGILQYKTIFAKGYAPNWSEEDFMIKKVKNAMLLLCVIKDLNGKKLLECIEKKDCKRQFKLILELKK